MTDISTKMLEIAEEYAKTENLQNVETKECDVSSLPFPNNHFDSVSCRFGFMFFKDLQEGVNN